MCKSVDSAMYLGYKEITLGDEALADFYSSGMSNDAIGCLTNEYLVICNESGEPVDKLRWSGTEFVKISKKPFVTKFGGKVAARNLQQELAFDLVQNNDITVKFLAGRFGSGKTFILSAAAVQMVENGVFDKIVFIRNNVEVKHSNPLGFLPGSMDEKLSVWCMDLADHLGGDAGLEMLMRQRIIEATHLGFLRGRDIKNSIILVNEAENLTKEHIQLIISRAGEGSQVWLDGDLKQRDAEIFVKNSGMACAIEKLAGHPRFGYVKLLKSERSETAAMADLLD